MRRPWRARAWTESTFGRINGPCVSAKTREGLRPFIRRARAAGWQHVTVWEIKPLPRTETWCSDERR